MRLMVQKEYSPPRRKGAVRRLDMPSDALQALNEGQEETITLVEWLAIDMPTQLRAVLPGVGLAEAREDLGEIANGLANDGVTKRLKGIGNALFEATQDDPQRWEIYEAQSSHKSDMVRVWAAYMLTANKDIKLADRLEATRRFASDDSVAVRECAWDSFRPYVAADLDLGLRLLEGWARDPDPHIRRCAVEGTRPRGVWTLHLETLKREPALALLEVVRSDPSKYVQRSVANWLNDASKSRTDWVLDVCRRWAEESPTKETTWTVNHAQRTLRKHRG